MRVRTGPLGDAGAPPLGPPLGAGVSTRARIFILTGAVIGGSAFHAFFFLVQRVVATDPGDETGGVLGALVGISALIAFVLGIACILGLICGLRPSRPPWTSPLWVSAHLIGTGTAYLLLLWWVSRVVLPGRAHGVLGIAGSFVALITAVVIFAAWEQSKWARRSGSSDASAQRDSAPGESDSTTDARPRDVIAFLLSFVVWYPIRTLILYLVLFLPPVLAGGLLAIWADALSGVAKSLVAAAGVLGAIVWMLVGFPILIGWLRTGRPGDS